MQSQSFHAAFLSKIQLQGQGLYRFVADNRLSSEALEKLERVLIASQFATGFLQRFPHLIATMLGLEQFTLDDNIIDTPSAGKIDLDLVRRQLREYRNRKLVEIIFIDVANRATIDSILENLSILADQLILCALKTANEHLAQKHGQPCDENNNPMQLNVIAMGKLGGRELNFSSDIDLICCYAGDGELSGFGQLSYHEYFSRLVKLVTRLLSDTTEHGFVYRVDLRLRPWGSSGPIVLSHAALEHYYQLHGREWEQYALVKARILSGSESDRKTLNSIIKPFVYRRYHDYHVIESLASLKDKIDSQARSNKMRDNIKIGRGGIREVEFFVQAMQILKGGRNQTLQIPGILDCFETLKIQGIVGADTIATLGDAYRFLRKLENRLQMLDDRQTHDLPESPVERNRIATTLYFDSWNELSTHLNLRRDQVSKLFNDLFKRDAGTTRKATISDGIFDEFPETQQFELIRASGTADIESIHCRLGEFFASKAWSFMSSRAKQRFTNLIPDLLQALVDGDHPAIAFERMLNLFSSIAGRSVYFELLHQHRGLLQKLVDLFAKSPWIAEQVCRYPILLENLIESGDQDRFDRGALQKRLHLLLDNVAGDVELELDSLRLFKREQTLVIASAELAGEISAEASSHYLCDLAEILLEAAYQLAEASLQQKHGVPQCLDRAKKREAKFVIIGYGKLGGMEMHYQSDLDIIFLHNSSGKQQFSNGEKRLDNSTYFSRLAQKLISIIGVLTGSGKLYEIDSRLRPDGASGLLVSSIQAYRSYQQDKAWTWEHQALVRARPVAGDRYLARKFGGIRKQILTISRDSNRLKQDIVDMRQRIYQNKRPPEGDFIDLKHSRGCIIDIEFLVQYWILEHATRHQSLCSQSDNIELIKTLFRLHLIDRSQAQLGEIYRTYQRLLHEAVLHNKSTEIDTNLIAAEVAHVVTCWDNCLSLQGK